MTRAPEEVQHLVSLLGNQNPTTSFPTMLATEQHAHEFE